MKKLKSESGRSMVEMLGVLAIIGVLSVGGIAGYTLSIRRHRANQVVDTVAKYALTTYNFCHLWVEGGQSDWNDVTECKRVTSMPRFEDSGIGDLPNGVSHIDYDGITYGKTEGSSSVNTDVQIVSTGVQFTDEKLCQAVASITGATWSGKCNYISIKIKQN